MAEHNDFGKQGEELARRYLAAQGYDIVECDWHLGHYDVDIIARQGEELVFVEVKTRSSTGFGMPEDWVDRRKQRAYIRLADHYVVQHNIPLEVRFDIISVVIANGESHLQHLVRAFSTTDV